MNKFSDTIAAQRRIADAPAALKIFCALFCIALVIPSAAVRAAAPVRGAVIRAAETGAPPTTPLENGASDDDDKDVPTAQVEKYISAYKAMQKDHNLTAEQAASKQGLTIAQFRSLEGRIERDDTLRERVRKALRAAAPGANKDSAD